MRVRFKQMPQYKYEATKYGSLKYLTYLSSLKAGGGGGNAPHSTEQHSASRNQSPSSPIVRKY